jgi:peptide/nickel transport system ATP-binding protein
MDPTRRTTKPPLAGDPPNPINPPSGCRFRDRCPHAEAVCASKVPALTALTDLPSRNSMGVHEVACHMTVMDSGHSAAPHLNLLEAA